MNQSQTWIRSDGHSAVVGWSIGEKRWQMLVGGDSRTEPQRLRFLVDDRGRGGDPVIDVVVQSIPNGSVDPASVSATEEWVWDRRHAGVSDTVPYWSTWQCLQGRWLPVSAQLPPRKSPCRIAALGNLEVETTVDDTHADDSPPPGPGFHPRWEMSQRDYRMYLNRYAELDKGRRPTMSLKRIGELVKSTAQYRMSQRPTPLGCATLRFSSTNTVLVVAFVPARKLRSDAIPRIPTVESADAAIIVGDVTGLLCPPNLTEVGDRRRRGMIVAVQPGQQETDVAGIVSTVTLKK